MPTNVSRYYDPNAEAKLLLGFLAVALVAGTGYICYSRLHVRKEQLMEASLYILAWSFVFWDVLRYVLTAPAEKENAWPHPPLRISRKQDNQALQKAFGEDSIVIGYDIHREPVLWADEVRVMQANGFGMTGAGKTTLLLNIIQQDLIRETGPKGSRHKIPLIIIDGKGEREFLDDKLLPLIATAGRLDDLRIIDPARPEISVRFNPFITISGQYQEHVSFIFESFDLREDFFHGHQKTYLSDIVRILYYTGKRYNIYDILVMAYDLDVLKEQAKIARARIETLPNVSHQQRLNFQMSVRNLVESFADPKRVKMIRGLINQMMTFLEDKLSIITGPYEDLISMEDVIEQGQILFVSLNTNKNDDTTRALGRMILQNLQLVIGERYERKRADMYMPFVSVIMDEFAPIAYSNFANILQTARGSNTAFLSPGKHTLEFDFKYNGLGMGTLAYNNISGIGQGGTGTLKVDGKTVATQTMEHTLPLILQWDENFDIGADTGTPVDDQDYKVPFTFNGTISKLTLTIDRPQLTPADIQKLQAAQRNNSASE